uniref:Ribosomal protein S3 n=1 Tax=Melosira undulata TaxID=2133757 RepID=A0A3G1PWF2_9STRA|nr:ribosomal protein S3 [Melosira undulata]AVR57559.1 ribosomal protein S3 [Melosira undulata]
MGQKTNPIIFRLGYKDNLCNSQYLENKFFNINLFIFQDIDIKKFLFQIFKQNNLIITFIKILRSESTVSLIIYYYIKIQIKFLIFKILKIWKFVFKKFKFKQLKKNNYKRIWIIKLIKYKFYIKKFKILKKNLICKILNILKNFYNIFINIFVILHNINKNNFLILTKNQKKKINIFKLHLRKYNKVKFYKENFNILIIFCNKKFSIPMLSNFICYQLEILKKHKFFFNFLKRILFLFITLKFSNLKGIKIQIKGRLNNKPRSNKHIILIGKLKLQTKKIRICYNESIAYSLNGTLGLKIWTN